MAHFPPQIGLLFLYTSELLPTVIRCSGFGTLSGISRIGTIVGIQVLKLNTDERPWPAGVIFGVITLIAAGLFLTLPETRNAKLCQTLDEAEIAFTQTINSDGHTKGSMKKLNISF